MKNRIINSMGSPLFIIAALLLVSFFVLTPVVNMVVLGAIIAYGIRPIARLFQKKIHFTNVSIILATLVIVIPLLVILIYFVSTISGFAYSYLSSHDLTNISNQISLAIEPYLPSSFSNSTNTVISSTGNLIDGILSYIFDYFIDLIKTLPMVSLQIFVLITSVFYFTRDGHKLKEYIFTFIPKVRKPYFENMILNIKLVLKSIFYGHFITGVIIGIIATVGYFILGIPNSLFLGILTGILQLIPIIGPWPVYFGIVIMDLINKNYIRAIVVLFFGFGISLSDMYIRPALTSKYADVHPMILLLGFLAGPLIFGISGFILGPLILGITFAVVKSFKQEQENFKDS